jgi:tetratricopeptide (TPR) repeat protein
MRLIAPVVGFLAARLPHLYGAAHDAEREEQRRVLAAFLAAPDAPAPLTTAGQAPGFSGTPGIGEAVLGQRLAFLGRAAEAKGDSEEARGHYARAASAFCRAARDLPDIDDNASDATRQLRLARSLALMLLAHHAVKAGLATRAWHRFGTAEEIARRAVAGQPLLPYLRFQHAEVLRMLGKHARAIEVLAEARPITPDLASRLKLADAAGAVAVDSGDAGLMAEVERGFITPLFGRHRDDGPEDPPEDDSDARGWAWIVAFRAGRLDYSRADAESPRGADGLALARRAARRLARSIALIPDDPERAKDRMYIAGLRSDAATLAGEIALSLGLADEACVAFADAREPARQDLAATVAGWTGRGHPARFAAAALLTPDRWAEPSRIAMRALAAASAERVDPERVALPPIREPIVVTVNDPLLMDEALANRIIGGEDAPSIAGLRRRLRERFGFALAGVRLRGVDDASAPRRIGVLFRGYEAATLTPPEGAALALAHPREAAAAGLTVLPGEAPVIDGLRCAWVPDGAAAPGILVLHPAFALVGVLEGAVLGAMHRLTGLDEAWHTLPAEPALPEEALGEALAVLRHLLAERMPLGRPGVMEEAARRIAAGDGPAQVMTHLRAMPALWPHLWGNEPGRRAVPLTPEGERRVLDGRLDALAAVLEGVEDPVLVVKLAERRAAVRAAVAARFPDLPVLAASERDERR